jgi:predicted nucleotidyltransferase
MEAIDSVLNAHNISEASKRGSVNFRDIHFCVEQQMSYSDVDLMVEHYPNPSEKAEQISLDIQQLTGLSIPVSIHTHNSLQQLTLPQSMDLSVLECIYQSHSQQYADVDYRRYIRSKFALLTCRVKVAESYDDIATRLATDNSNYWYGVKTGELTLAEQAQGKCEWPEHAQHYPQFWQLFFADKLDLQHSQAFYHQVMANCSLSVELKQRLETKLDTVDFPYD